MTEDAVDRTNGPVIEQLTRWCETRRQEAVKHLLSRLKGKLSDADRAATEKAFGHFQHQFLHGPIRALTEETHAGAASGYTLVEALFKLWKYWPLAVELDCYHRDDVMISSPILRVSTSIALLRATTRQSIRLSPV
jgi:hypothetical protein